MTDGVPPFKRSQSSAVSERPRSRPFPFQYYSRRAERASRLAEQSSADFTQL